MADSQERWQMLADAAASAGYSFSYRGIADALLPVVADVVASAVAERDAALARVAEVMARCAVQHTRRHIAESAR